MSASEAREFSTTESYAKDDLVMKLGVLYQFTANHSAGAWNDAQVEKFDKKNETEITIFLTEVDRIQKYTAYASSIKFTTAQISGTRYKGILTNQSDPR